MGRHRGGGGSISPKPRLSSSSDALATWNSLPPLLCRTMSSAVSTRNSSETSSESRGCASSASRWESLSPTMPASGSTGSSRDTGSSSWIPSGGGPDSTDRSSSSSASGTASSALALSDWDTQPCIASRGASGSGGGLIAGALGLRYR